MTPEQSMVFGNEDSPVIMTGGFMPSLLCIMTSLKFLRPFKMDKKLLGGTTITAYFVEQRNLGAQAGEKRLREVAISGGFSDFRRAAETPFNLILEGKP